VFGFGTFGQLTFAQSSAQQQALEVVLAATEAPDTASATVALVQNATLAATEGQDTAAVTVALLQNVTLAATEAPDTLSATVELQAVATPTGGQIVGGTFSRKRWRELQDAISAQRRAEERVQDLKQKKRAALAQAAKAAEQAIEAAQAEQSADLVRLTRLLEAATRAQTTADVVRAANQAIKLANAIRLEAEEEEAIIMLLAA
jgi:predicted HD phosphohydrolase